MRALLGERHRDPYAGRRPHSPVSRERRSASVGSDQSAIPLRFLSQCEDRSGARTMRPRQCEHCGKEVSRPPKKRDAARFCDKTCWGAWRTVQAKARRAALKAERLARRIALREEKREEAKRPARSFACRRCASPVETQDWRRRIFCGLACARAYSRKRFRKKTGMRKHPSRARRYGLPVDRGITRRKVFERDKWRCGLCGQRTLRRLDGTQEPRAPELDHIVPLNAKDADGRRVSPGHVWSNVQCACHACNVRKQAKIRGQLRLV